MPRAQGKTESEKEMNESYRIDRTLLYEEVVSALYAMIDRKEVTLGGKFPSERELTEELGVSRNVLREAFHILENRGIVVSKQGSGRYLRSVPKMEQTEKKYESLTKNLERITLRETYEVRQVLEAKTMDLIVKNAEDEEILELEKCYDEMKQQFEETQSTAGEFKLHTMYGKICGNAFMEHMMAIVLSATLDMMSNRFSEILITHSKENELKSHREIIDALKARESERAQKLMYIHLGETLSMLE